MTTTIRRGLALVVGAALFFFIGYLATDGGTTEGIGQGFLAVGSLALVVGLAALLYGVLRS